MSETDFVVNEQFEQQVSSIKEAPVERWRIIDISKITDARSKAIAYRLNALGSLYFFIKVVLRRDRLTDSLHRPICENLEKFHLKEVIEFPRDHYKTVIHSEGAPMWWALPFSDVDEQYMRHLGYGDSFIKWMRRAHDINTRTLLISENISNAKKIGFRINHHYNNNSLFRGLFKEVLPNEKCKWTEESMHHLRTKDSPNGEGTYDFLGVGGALQSRHYDRVIQDDLIGKAALKSEAVMDSTIEYHKLIVGAFDSSSDNAVEDNDEIVVGNRWSEKDLNAHIRDNETYFNFTNHSAEGGCCPQHPLGTPIFPEQFSIEKLIRWKQRLGSYLYSCQFLNNPVAPGSTRWSESYLNYYFFDLIDKRVNPETGGWIDPRIKIVHETKNGFCPKDIMPRDLQISLVCDPNHAGQSGRCRHAIVVSGIHKKFSRLYLLDVWAESASYDKLCNKLAELVQKWRLREIYLETVAAQKYLKYHLETIWRIKGINCKIKELKTDRSENGKAMRIEGMDAIYENGQVYCKRTDLAFIEEFTKYPVGKTVDVLDVVGYAPQTWGGATSLQDVKATMERLNSRNPYAQSSSSEGRSQLTGY